MATRTTQWQPRPDWCKELELNYLMELRCVVGFVGIILITYQWNMTSVLSFSVLVNKTATKEHCTLS